MVIPREDKWRGEPQTLLSLHKFDSFVLWSDQVSVFANRGRRESIDVNWVQQSLQRIVRADVLSTQEVSRFLCLLASKCNVKDVRKLTYKLFKTKLNADLAKTRGNESTYLNV